MKFSEMFYTRPDPAASKQRTFPLTAELKAAKSMRKRARCFRSRGADEPHLTA